MSETIRNPMQSDATLIAEHVAISFGTGSVSNKVLNDVSVEFKRGQLTLILGPSGSGKTTLLSILGCLLAPDEGRISVMGRVAHTLSESEAGEVRRRHIGFVFQAFRLFHALDAVENVMVALRINGHGEKRARESAVAALQSLGLEDKLHLRPDELSGGEKQRVAIARALSNNPTIILADEPTASLDSRSGDQIAEILFSLAADQNRLVVVVSHDHRWIKRSHRMITMTDGKVIEDKLDHRETVR